MSPLDAPVALILIGLAFLACCLILNHAVRHASDIEPEPSGWDRLDGVGRQFCSVRGCNAEPTVSVHAGHDYWPMCAAHAVPYLLDRDLTYSEQRALHDDRRRITGEAAGGGL